ncbi:TonB-dependent receptor [Biformimicrobium ophioploci]|uniref:TonB-dependent receptor n=1 Tax=Biformimicrobium ophioploci TaxID=3036711 RepID=A0ABQ6LZ08_9GAMM|nr:TonB-dependent receptor [Microbulbifer sp. NKW57]GMG87277.1 TonB-dependent receptor [Microbulbifer sp. NKW57]
MNWRLATAPIAALLALGNPAHADTCASENLSVPAGPLENALISLGKSCKVSVIFESKAAASLLVPAHTFATSSGDVDQLLSDFLQRTQFDHRKISPGVYAIVDRQRRIDEESVPVEEKPDEILVTARHLTGTHLRRQHFDGYAPVDVLAQPELEITGARTVAELLKYLPSVAGNSTSTAVSNGGNGTASVTLRGLPATNTLVLLNGRRVALDGYGGKSADLNNIPLAAVDRIEILKSGASAVYGSDAIAGVVNIILRTDFTGFEANSYAGSSEQTGLDTSSHHISWGTNGERGQVMLNLSHYKRSALWSRDRALSENADNRNRGGSDQRSSATPNARILFSSDGTRILREGADGDSPDDFRAATAEDLFNYREYTSSTSPSERDALYLYASGDLTDGTEVFLESLLSRTKSSVVYAPTPVFTRFDNGDLTVAPDQAYNPFGEAVGDVRKRFVELGPRVQDNATNNLRFTLGINGGSEDWVWNMALNHHVASADENISNLIDPVRLGQALKGPDACSGDCVPVNLFGPAGSVTAQQADFIRARGTFDGYSRLSSFSATFSGIPAQLPTGELLVATGFELRSEHIDFHSGNGAGTNIGNLTLLGTVNAGAAEGDRLVAEAFAESSLPLVKDRLWLDGAVRHSAYSDFGKTTNPRVSLRFEPLPSVVMRASYATGFRAPSLSDLHQQGYESQAFLVDPCASSQGPRSGGCLLPSDPTRIQFLTLYSGNPDLKPETSENVSVGVIWTPANIKSLQASLDAFEIRQNDVVDTNPQYLLNENARLGLFRDQVLRDSYGDITRILAPTMNIGAREIRGADLSVRFDRQTEKLGRLKLSLNASYTDRYRNQAAPGVPFHDVAGTFTDEARGGLGAIPRWKANTGLYWQRGRWEGGYTVHFVDDLKETFEVGKNTVRTIKSWTSHDMQIAYAIPAGIRVAIGVDNLLDQAPPFAATAFNDNFDARTYDLGGRYWYTTFALSR